MGKHIQLALIQLVWTYRVFCPEVEIALREIRHNVHDLLHGEVAHVLLVGIYSIQTVQYLLCT